MSDQIRTRLEFQCRSGTGSRGFWAGTGSGPVDLAGTAIFSCWIIGFLCFALISYLHHVPPPVTWLDHVQCAPLRPPVPRLYHVLPSSSQTTSRAPLQFHNCITCCPSVPKIYHVPPPPPPPYLLWRHLER